VKIQGHITKSGKWYVVHLPALNGSTQARTRSEFLVMAADYVRCTVPPIGAPQGTEVAAVAKWRDKQTFEVECSRPELLVAAILRQMRSKADMSLRDVAVQLGIKSVNAYARFETGKSVPTVAKLDELLKAVGASDVVVF
jgi:hypothetical protein